MADAGQAVFRAIADFSKLRREARKTSRDIEDLRDETQDVNRALGRTERAADAAAEGLDEAGDEARDAARQLHRLEREGNAAQRALTGAAAAAATFGATVRRSPVARFVGWLSQLRRRAADAGVDLDRLDKRVNRVGKSFFAAAGSVAKFTAVLGGIALITGAVHATVAGVLSLLGALGALSGAVGVLPGLLAAAGVAMATLKIGTTGFGDAIKAVAEGDLEKFKESVKDLAPSARATAWAIWDLRPALKQLRDGVQQVLFFEFADLVRRLGATYLPILDRALTSVAASFNSAAKQAGEFLLEAAQVADIEGILDDVAVAFTKLDGIAENVVAAFLDLTAVSADFLPDLSSGLDDATGRFRRFMRQARESGRLAEWIQTGIDALARLGSILGNVGSTLYGVFKAGDAVGANFLATLDRLTQSMADFVHSARGQRALGSFFLSARRAGEALLPVLAAIVVNLGDHVAPVLARISEKLGPGLVDVVDGIGAAFSNAEPGLVAFFDGVSELLSALGDAGPLIGDMASGMATVLTPVLYALAGVLKAVTAAWNSLPGPVQAVISVFGGAALAGGALLLVLYKIIKTAKRVKAAMATVAAVTGFSGAGSAAAGGAAGAAAQRGFLARFGAGLKGKLGSILETALLGMLFFPGAVGKIARKAKGLFTGGFKGVGPAAAGTMGRVGNAIKGVGPKALAVAGKLKWLRLAFSATPWGLAINGLILAGTAVWQHWDSVTSGVKSAWDGTVSFFQGLGPRIQTAWQATGEWFANLPTTAQQTVEGMGAWFDQLPGRLGYAAGYAGSWVVGKVGEMKDRVLVDTGALVLGATNWFSQLPGRLGNLAGQAGTWVKNTWRDMQTRVLADTTALVIGVSGWFSQLPGRLGNFARQAGTATKNAFVDMRNRVIADTTALALRVVDIIRGLPGKIKSFAGAFWQAGVDLVTGLWRGIESMAWRVVRAITGMVIQAKEGAEREARSRSPSRVFMAIGAHIGEGLALGIERMRSRVLDVVADLISRLAAAFGRGGLGARIAEQFRNLPDKLVLGAVSAGTRRQAPHRPTAAPRAPATRGQLMARALPPNTGQRFPDVHDQVSAVASAVQSRLAGQQASRDVTVNFGDVVNPLPEPASDTAARKLRTLALMGAFG